MLGWEIFGSRVCFILNCLSGARPTVRHTEIWSHSLVTGPASVLKTHIPRNGNDGLTEGIQFILWMDEQSWKGLQGYATGISLINCLGVYVNEIKSHL